MRLKGFRRIFSRFDKLDVVVKFFIYFALIVDTLMSVNRPQQISFRKPLIGDITSKRIMGERGSPHSPDGQQVKNCNSRLFHR